MLWGCERYLLLVPLRLEFLLGRRMSLAGQLSINNLPRSACGYGVEGPRLAGVVPCLVPCFPFHPSNHLVRRLGRLGRPQGCKRSWTETQAYLFGLTTCLHEFCRLPRNAGKQTIEHLANSSCSYSRACILIDLLRGSSVFRRASQACMLELHRASMKAHRCPEKRGGCLGRMAPPGTQWLP